MKDTSSSIHFYEIIKFLLEKKIDDDMYKCCICTEYTKTFYLICKSECLDYSYCKNCIEIIERKRKKCPFTNIDFTYKDICLDIRKNKMIEKQIEIYNKLGNTIKNISVNIETNANNLHKLNDNIILFK